MPTKINAKIPFLNRNFAEQHNSEYIFVVDAEAHVDNANTLIELIKQNRYETKM